jgi:uncharacterized protein (DUF1499 family)
MKRQLFSRALAGLLLVLCWIFTPQTVSAQSLVQYPSSFMAIFSFAGNRPDNLGVQNGQLAACPASPNCVSSQASTTDKEHYVAPIAYEGAGTETLAKLKNLIEGLERTTIIESSNTYLYAEFASKLMGFVDDVEFFVDDSAKVIHVRSASRLGQSDLGVNRQRIEDLRTQFT